MSSHRSSSSRKRRSDDELSDSDSDDNVRPLKKSRQCNGETNIKQVFASKCKNLLRWVSTLPLKDYFKEGLLRRSLMYQTPVDIIDVDDDEEEDENEVIVIPEDDEVEDDVAVVAEENDYPLLHSPRLMKERIGLLKEKRYSLSTRSAPTYPFSGLQSTKSSFNISSRPLSTSTPFYRDYGSLHSKASNSTSQKSLNGFQSKSRKSQDTFLKKSSPRAPITNPSTDVEILLDPPVISLEDSDELEVVSEISSLKQTSELSRKTLSPISNLAHSLANPDVNSQGSMKNGQLSNPSASGIMNTSLNKSFTAYEVIRLQEKAQYKLLLDKIVTTSRYRPVIKRKEMKPVEIQVDLTTDDEEPITICHYKKETLQKPITEFLEAYYKPRCRLVSPKPSETNTQKQTKEVVRKEEEDIKVIENRLPEYKRKMKHKPDFFSSDWIAELKTTINEETEKRLQMVSVQQDKVDRYKKRRDAENAEKTRLYDQFKVPGDVLPDLCIIENEFPELTADMEAVVASAQEQGNPLEELSRLDSQSAVTRSDLSTLIGLQWLNDAVINFYFALIVERGKLDNSPSVYAFNTYFYPAYKTRGERSVLRWTRKVDIFSYDIIMVPLHLGMHWALAVIDNRVKRIQYYDSMRGSEEQCLYILQTYLVAEMKDKKKIVMDPNTYSTEVVKDNPQQMNGSDCGMFTLKYAEYISRDAPITFTQENMPYFRNKMTYEIMTKQLL